MSPPQAINRAPTLLKQHRFAPGEEIVMRRPGSRSPGWCAPKRMEVSKGLGGHP